MRQSFTIPGRLNGLNDYTGACRANANAGGRMKRDNQAKVVEAIKAARLRRAHGRVNVRIHWVEPNMRRDKDNVCFAKKFILDGLVDAGILENDNWTYIGDFSERFSVNAADPRIEVEIEEA